jgi:uncharacterized protein YndB with AHSA1/START domain
MEKVFEIYIKTTPESLWHAITDPETRRKYHLGVAPGEGEVVEVEPPCRLVQTMLATWSEEVKREGQSRITWEIDPVGDSCRLIVTHDRLREGANEELYGGWPMILSALKTLLETGESLTTPMSLHFADVGKAPA